MPGQDAFSLTAVYKLAIGRANSPVLKWVFKETKGNLPRIDYPYTNSSADTVAWLIEHGDYHSFTWLLLDKLTAKTSFQSIKRCFAYQDENSAFQIYRTENAVDDLQWLY